MVDSTEVVRVMREEMDRSYCPLCRQQLRRICADLLDDLGGAVDHPEGEGDFQRRIADTVEQNVRDGGSVLREVVLRTREGGKSMSLGEAVLAVAGAMEKEAAAKNSQGGFIHDLASRVLLQGFARELRTAVTAVRAERMQVTGGEVVTYEGEDLCPPFRRSICVKPPCGPDGEEEDPPRFARVEGGGSDGDLVVVALDMPAGAHMYVGGEVYRMGDDGVLHHVGRGREEVQ